MKNDNQKIIVWLIAILVLTSTPSTIQASGTFKVVFKNWNNQPCSLTGTAYFNLKKNVTIGKLTSLYHWQAKQTKVPYRIYHNQQILHQNVFKRGACHPNKEAWCPAVDRMNLRLKPSNYAVMVQVPRMCQNPQSGNNGFLEIRTAKVPKKKATPRGSAVNVAFNNWNRQNCAVTSIANFNLQKPSTVNKLSTLYYWQANQTSVPYRLYQGQQLLYQNAFHRGSCHPTQATWCPASDKLSFPLQAGNYTVMVQVPSICQNPQSGNNGFIEVTVGPYRTPSKRPKNGQTEVVTQVPPPQTPVSSTGQAQHHASASQQLPAERAAEQQPQNISPQTSPTPPVDPSPSSIPVSPGDMQGQTAEVQQGQASSPSASQSASSEPQGGWNEPSQTLPSTKEPSQGTQTSSDTVANRIIDGNRVKLERKKVNNRYLSFLKGESMPFTGEYTTKHSNGQLWQQMFFKEGISVGVHKAWHANGQIEVIRPFVNGKPDGKYQSFYENGQLKKEVTYKEGKQLPPIKEFFSNGKIKIQDAASVMGKREGVKKEFYQSGTLKRETPYINGKINGLKKEYFENGKIKEEMPYENGKGQGDKKIYYENGQLREISPRVNGKREGTAKVWNEDGTLRFQVPNKNDKWNGIMIKYDYKNKIKKEITYVKGKRKGMEKWFDFNGKLIKTLTN
ncbi:MAG: toxin-antitoxin system YwqK family antitoxin [SAR324 cluster bacterium]|nr:toxin-antitoxin system YwqK family antitoxin [SAR324 cluster bacterium]